MKFCAKQIGKQLDRGGEFMFEHPWPSEAWSKPCLQSLKRKYGVKRVDMCAYGLKCPDTELPIQKATGLLLSATGHDAQPYLKQCPGCPEHRRVEGKLQSGQNVSEYVAEYTPQFVNAILDASLNHKQVERESMYVQLQDHPDTSCLVADAGSDEPRAPDIVEESVDPKIMSAIKKLHVNLGHPSTRDMIRILRHSKASSEAIKAAQSFQCSVCANHQKPASALPAKTGRVGEFNSKVGLDAKYLPGWKPNQRVPCISIVDYATSMHVMAPIFTKESAELIKGVFRDSWVNWAGPPEVLETDPSEPNMSRDVANFCDGLGIHIQSIAAGSHWQLGKVERHGSWFESIFQRVCDECQPQSAEEFVECVIQTQSAKNALITEAGASPYQLVQSPKIYYRITLMS